MSFHRFDQSARATEALPSALRGGLLEQLRHLRPEWKPYPADNVQDGLPWHLSMLVGVHESVPESKVRAWTLIGEWYPGELYALLVRYSDGALAVLCWKGALPDGHGTRIMVLGEVEYDEREGRFRP